MIDRRRWRAEIAKRFRQAERFKDVGCMDGWKELICDLVDQLDATGVKYNVVQVKEKWGGLRFYVSHPGVRSPLRVDLLVVGKSKAGLLSSRGAPGKRAAFHQLIREAEAKSLAMCEGCGEPGTARRGFWIKTLCDSCHKSKAWMKGPG